MAAAPEVSTDAGSPATRAAGRRRRLVIALVLGVVVVVAEIVGGALARSTGLLADAGHNLADLAGLSLTYVALRVTLRSPTTTRSFGYHRATILTAVANVGVLGLVTVLLVIEAVTRLVHPVRVDSLPVLVIALVVLVVNLAGALVLRDPSHLGLRAAALHLRSDALSAAGVATSGVVELLTGWYRLDGIVSLLIAVAIAVSGIRIARVGVDVLLESTPTDLDPENLRTTLCAHPGVLGVHDLHCWSLSHEMRALSAHLVLSGHPSLAEAHRVGEEEKRALRERFNIAHATLELECEGCGDEDEASCAFDPASLDGRVV